MARGPATPHRLRAGRSTRRAGESSLNEQRPSSLFFTAPKHENIPRGIFGSSSSSSSSWMWCTALSAVMRFMLRAWRRLPFAGVPAAPEPSPPPSDPAEPLSPAPRSPLDPPRPPAPCLDSSKFTRRPSASACACCSACCARDAARSSRYLSKSRKDATRHSATMCSLLICAQRAGRGAGQRRVRGGWEGCSLRGEGLSANHQSTIG